MASDRSIAQRLAPIHDLIDSLRDDVPVHGTLGPFRYLIALEDDSPFPSGNRNRVRWYGGDPDEALFDHIIGRYDAYDIERWFLHAHDAPRRTQLIDLAERYGLEEFDGPSYPVLMHSLAHIPEIVTRYRIETIDHLTPVAIALLGGPMDGPIAAKLVSRADTRFFAAYLNETLIAVAGVLIDDGTAYLGWAATREDQRGNGAHQALIAARLTHARERKCSCALVETISMLTRSLSNLETMGFREVYHRVVMQHGG